jgi:sugar diacid utilization regulator
VLSNEVTLGYIALQEDPELEESSFDEAGLLALANYAAIACSLPLGNEHVRREIVDETKTGFLRELLNDDFSHTRAASQAGKIGFNNDLPHRVVVACPLVCGKTNDTPLLNAPARQRVLDVAARVFHRLAPQALLLVEEDHLTVILEEDSEETRRQALSEVRRLFDKVDLSLGASSPVKDAAELPRAYQEALKACQAGMTFANLRRGDMLSFERLGFYGLLTQVSSGNGELTSFVEDVLGPLVDYDRTRKRTLLMTVRSFLANHGSLVRTCEDLRIQPSTLTYRIQRIKTIGNLDLYSIDDMLLAQAAMLIWDGGLDSELRDSLAKRSKSGRGAGRKLALASSFI